MESELPEITQEALEWAVKISARAQKAAYDEQDAEFKKLLKERLPMLRCIGCGAKLQYDSEHNYFHDGGLLIDRMGYGSAKHDMAKVAVLVCDDCVEAKGISCDWLLKLSKHFEAQAATPAPPDPTRSQPQG